MNVFDKGSISVCIILNAAMPAFSSEQVLSDREKTIIIMADEAVKTRPDKLSPADVSNITDMINIRARGENLSHNLPELEPLHDPSVPVLKAPPPSIPTTAPEAAPKGVNPVEEALGKVKEKVLETLTREIPPPFNKLAVKALDQATSIEKLNEDNDQSLLKERERQEVVEARRTAQAEATRREAAQAEAARREAAQAEAARREAEAMRREMRMAQESARRQAEEMRRIQDSTRRQEEERQHMRDLQREMRMQFPGALTH